MRASTDRLRPTACLCLGVVCDFVCRKASPSPPPKSGMSAPLLALLSVLVVLLGSAVHLEGAALSKRSYSDQSVRGYLTEVRARLSSPMSLYLSSYKSKTELLFRVKCFENIFFFFQNLSWISPNRILFSLRRSICEARNTNTHRKTFLIQE